MVRGDCIGYSVGGRERESEVVVELRFLWHGANGGFEEWQRLIESTALVERHAQEMRRQRMRGRLRERGTIASLRGVEVASLVDRHCVADKHVGIGRRGWRRHARRSERTV